MGDGILDQCEEVDFISSSFEWYLNWEGEWQYMGDSLTDHKMIMLAANRLVKDS